MTVDIARGDLLELAERCERATGPGRELDCAIGRLAGAAKEQPDGTWMTYHKDGYAHSINPPAYTASLDAAMTLVDPRALWAHGSMEEGPFARLCWPMPNGGFVGGYVEASAASVPLAICAAALRALQESSHDRA